MNWIRRFFSRFSATRANWHITHVSSDANFNLYGATYSEAVAELRHRYPEARIVQIDAEWHVIMFRG